MAADPAREAIRARVIAAIEGLNSCKAAISASTPIPSHSSMRLLAKLAGCAAAAPGWADAEVAGMLVQYGENAAG